MKKLVINSDVYKIAVRMAAWNGAKWHETPYGAYRSNDCFSAAIVRDAADMGFTVKYGHAGKLTPMPHYGESMELSDAFDSVTASKKRHTTPLMDRKRYHEWKEDGYWYNQKRYLVHNGTPLSKTTIAQDCATFMKYLKMSVNQTRRPNFADISYWAETLSERMKERRNELNARMNFPEYVVHSLTNVNNLPF